MRHKIEYIIGIFLFLLIFGFYAYVIGLKINNFLYDNLKINNFYFWCIYAIICVTIGGFYFYRVAKRDIKEKKSHTEYLKLRRIGINQKYEEQQKRERIEKKERQKREEILRKEREEQMKKVNFIFDLTPREFENEIAAIYSKLGYEVKITTYTNDKGVDVIAIKEKVKFAIQCKRLQKDKVISRPELQKLYGGMASVKARRGIFVTTCKFSAPALEFARNNRIECIDLEQLVEIINKIY